MYGLEQKLVKISGRELSLKKSSGKASQRIKFSEGRALPA